MEVQENLLSLLCSQTSEPWLAKILNEQPEEKQLDGQAL